MISTCNLEINQLVNRPMNHLQVIDYNICLEVLMKQSSTGCKNIWGVIFRAHLVQFRPNLNFVFATTVAGTVASGLTYYFLY